MRNESDVLDTSASCHLHEKPLTRCKTPFDSKSYACYLCKEVAQPGTLCNVATFQLDTRIRSCAAELKDDKLFG